MKRAAGFDDIRSAHGEPHHSISIFPYVFARRQPV